MNWYQMESQEVMDKLNRFKDRGLSQKEVIKRQRHYGKNELQSEKGPGFFRQFAAQFKDFMILTLLAAAGISFFASYAQGEMNLTDPLIILAIVILNALLGIYQEKKAEHSLAHLRSLQTPQCQVLRDGKRQTISSPELVPGDLVYLDTGPPMADFSLRTICRQMNPPLPAKREASKKIPTRCIWKIFHSATSSIWYFRAQ